MCGLAFQHSFIGQPVNEAIYKQFDRQRGRGTQGFGVFDGRHNHLVKAAEEDRIKLWLAKKKNESDLLLFHHRMPTSTINVRQAAHPFASGEYFGKIEYVLIHNGHISNSRELFSKHKELGITYSSLLEDGTFNDSESLMWDFALTMQGKQPELTARGGMALICLKLLNGEPKALYFGRNSNPIYMTRDTEGLLLSSTGLSPEELARRRGLNLPTEELIPSNTLHTFYFGNKATRTQAFTFPQVVYHPVSNAGNYNRAHNGSYPGQNNLVWFRYPDGIFRERYFWSLTKSERKQYRKQQKQLDTTSWETSRDSGRPYAPSTPTTDPRRKVLPIKVQDGSTEPVRGSESKSEPRQLTLGEQYYNERRTTEPTIGEVQNKAMVYLCASSGVFYKANKAMEADLHVLRAQAPTDGNIFARVALLKAIQHLQNDPEWKNPQSVSSEWRELWSQNPSTQTA